ncbi:MAG: arsenosugar biosynthesis radical SAM protein ArsS [Flavobacteriales bacterium]|nr:arsenosugar biosynthesis radical SAM protein ArsS [Flavobacteriales bacterium]
MIKSLKARGNQLAKVSKQIEILSDIDNQPRFSDKLRNIGLFPLKPTVIDILQINVGYMCNQTCEHCHVDAGPDRKEIMTKQTMQYCLEAIDNSSIKTVDLTGGAPEMNPNFVWFVEQLSKRKVHVIVRSNLTILVANKKYYSYPQFFKKHGVEVIASLPCYTKENTDKQRGEGVFESSMRALQLLNEVGYGRSGTGLKLNLVFNPGGASIAPAQETLEVDYKKKLDIEFNNLYTITNLPISRFLDYLLVTGKFQEYMTKLVESFNPHAAKNVMCRNTISVSWDGDLFDCDFNQMLHLRVESKSPQHIIDFNEEQLKERSIVLNNHCYGCTAGAGSSCQGALT